MLNAEDLQCFEPSKMKKCEVDFEERVDAVASREAGSKLGIFAMIVKISLGIAKILQS